MSAFVIRRRWIALVLSVTPIPLHARHSISVPISGELPVRCSVETHEMVVDEGSASTTIIIHVNHSCNTRNNPIVTLQPGPEAGAIDFTATYDGRAPSMTAPGRAIFFEDGPSREMREILLRSDGLRLWTAEMVARIEILVEPV